jgi:hypothetical protein
MGREAMETEAGSRSPYVPGPREEDSGQGNSGEADLSEDDSMSVGRACLGS